ncbi:glycosyl hydrolase [Cohnella pontilimi]|nr:glycosyl hydrolase [Cohnella pontilimi]
MKLKKVAMLLLTLCLLAVSFSYKSVTLADTRWNPNMTKEARNVLKYLYTISGKNILAGQHYYSVEPNANWAQEISGKAPAVWGNDFSWDEVASYRQGVVDKAIEMWNSGSLVTLSFHQNKPNDPPETGWSSVQGWYTEEEMQQLVTPGTELYNQWLVKVDAIAGYLKQLQDAGVPVLWRPYHENNASWFWWGGRADLFKKLWANMYDRYTNHFKLNNLIWVWSAANPNDWSLPMEPFYPGDDKVDILGMDIYDPYKQSFYDGLLKLANGKPIVISECGNLPDIDFLKQNQPKWAYFLEWGNLLMQNNTEEQITAVYSNPYTITKETLKVPAVNMKGNP